MVKLIVDDEQERAEYTGDWFAGILISAEQESDNVTILNMHAMTLLKNVKELKNEVGQKLRNSRRAGGVRVGLRACGGVRRTQ